MNTRWTFDAKRRRGKAAQRVLAAIAAVVLTASFAVADELNEMSLDRWKELREVERYQFQIAEKYFREKNWKVAAAEYEKYLTLYERSAGAPHAQLKWSLCQVELRKLNTAIKDGFQSVIDYWPDSADAVAAAYFIGRTYKDMGEIKSAKRAYNTVLTKHAEHLAAVYTMTDLVDVAALEDNIDTRVDLWKKLTFEAKRTKEANRHCVTASQQLAAHLFTTGAFDQAVKALETTYQPEQLPYYVLQYARGPISTLTADDKTKVAGERVADQAVAFVRSRIPTEKETDEQKQAVLNHWFYIVDLQSASRRDEQVLATFKQMESAIGNDDAVLSKLGGWYKSRGKYDEARATYRRFQDKVAGSAEIAYSFHQQAKYPEAVVAYRQVAGLDPENQLKWNEQIAYNLRLAKKWQEAVTVYESMIALDAERPDRWRYLVGYTYEEANQFKQAIGVYRQCENFPENYWRMANCQRALKQYGEAITIYNQIAGGAESWAPRALLQIGYTREQAGQQEEAIRAFQQVCRRFPKDSNASQAHAHLQTKYKISVTLGGGTDE